MSFLLQLEDGNDTLVIHNGGNEDSKIVQKLTGQMNETKISIPGNQMFVVFKTNKDTVRKGFNAKIIESEFYLYLLPIKIRNNPFVISLFSINDFLRYR